MRIDQYGDSPELLFHMGLFLAVMGLILLGMAALLILRSYA